MGITTEVKCDVCEKQKQQTNHWYMVNVSYESIVIRPLDTNDLDEFQWIICCGEGCTSNYLSAKLATLHSQ